MSDFFYGFSDNDDHDDDLSAFAPRTNSVVHFLPRIYSILRSAELFFNLPVALQRRAAQIFHLFTSALPRRHSHGLMGLAFLHATAEQRGGTVLFIGDVLLFCDPSLLKKPATNAVSSILSIPESHDIIEVIDQLAKTQPKQVRKRKFKQINVLKLPTGNKFLQSTGKASSESSASNDEEQDMDRFLDEIFGDKQDTEKQKMTYEKILRIYAQATEAAGMPFLLFDVEAAAMQIINEAHVKRVRQEQAVNSSGIYGGVLNGQVLTNTNELGEQEKSSIITEVLCLWEQAKQHHLISWPPNFQRRSVRYEAVVAGCVMAALRRRGWTEGSREAIAKAVRLEKRATNVFYVWMKRVEAMTSGVQRKAAAEVTVEQLLDNLS
jgi:hypothetical protein